MTYQDDQKKVARGVTDGSKVAFVQHPKAVGNWVLYANAPQTMKFRMYAKPTDEQIKNTEALLGWKWEDV